MSSLAKLRRRNDRLKRCIAELLGTFALVAVGTGAAMVAATTRRLAIPASRLPAASSSR